MLRALVLCVLMFATVGGAAAQTPTSGNAETIAVARAYMDAYQALDLHRLEAFYAEDVAFNDPTSVQAPGVGGPFIWRGRAEVLAGIRDWKSYVHSLNYNVEHIYEASGQVVFVGDVNPLVSTANGPAQYRYHIVTIVTVEDGQVAEHRDYTDYAGAVQVPIAAP